MRDARVFALIISTALALVGLALVFVLPISEVPERSIDAIEVLLLSSCTLSLLAIASREGGDRQGRSME